MEEFGRRVMLSVKEASRQQMGHQQGAEHTIGGSSLNPSFSLIPPKTHINAPTHTCQHTSESTPLLCDSSSPSHSSAVFSFLYSFSFFCCSATVVLTVGALAFMSYTQTRIGLLKYTLKSKHLTAV